MTLREFHNAVRVLYNIDPWDLPDGIDWYFRFADNPVQFLIRCDDERAEIIWQAMLKKGVK